MVGRVGLLWLNQKIGERRAIFLYALIAIGCVLPVSPSSASSPPFNPWNSPLTHRAPPFPTGRLELVVWLVPHLLSSAISVAFVGFFLGPVFPIVMNHAGAILPPELISGGIAWITGFGAAGAAAFPFITGAIASGTSINSLQPL